MTIPLSPLYSHQFKRGLYTWLGNLFLSTSTICTEVYIAGPVFTLHLKQKDQGRREMRITEAKQVKQWVMHSWLDGKGECKFKGHDALGKNKRLEGTLIPCHFLPRHHWPLGTALRQALRLLPYAVFTSFNPHNSFVKGTFSVSFPRWGNWGSDKRRTVFH